MTELTKLQLRLAGFGLDLTRLALLYITVALSKASIHISLALHGPCGACYPGEAAAPIQCSRPARHGGLCAHRTSNNKYYIWKS